MERIKWIEDYSNSSIEEEIEENRKYMCNKCFYKTDEYEYIIEHLYMNCINRNGNNNSFYFKTIIVNK
jgi:hypothetical protein